ncbi:hypothetical protein K438DRAFT_2014923 [Mycena galopus ATCC 62051]|nr:hypothetical protein K438DRAFT_2014923 [Mycena galopus ATCC 62051]
MPQLWVQGAKATSKAAGQALVDIFLTSGGNTIDTSIYMQARRPRQYWPINIGAVAEFYFIADKNGASTVCWSVKRNKNFLKKLDIRFYGYSLFAGDILSGKALRISVWGLRMDLDPILAQRALSRRWSDTPFWWNCVMRRQTRAFPSPSRVPLATVRGFQGRCNRCRRIHR